MSSRSDIRFGILVTNIQPIIDIENNDTIQFWSCILYIQTYINMSYDNIKFETFNIDKDLDLIYKNYFNYKKEIKYDYNSN